MRNPRGGGADQQSSSTAASWWRRDRGQALVWLMVAAVVGVSAFGAGWTATGQQLADGATWLVKGTSVVHANAASGRVDAEVVRDLAGDGEGLEAVEVPGGGLYAVDHGTGSVTRIDPVTAEPAAERASDTDVRVVGDGESVYVVDPAGGAVEQVDPRTLEPVQTFDVGGPVLDQVVDARGTLWVVAQGANEVRPVDGPDGVRPVPISGDGARLTTVGGDLVVVDAAAGLVVTVDKDARARRIATPAFTGPVQVQVPGLDGDVVWVIDQTAGTATAVDLVRGTAAAAIPLGVGSGADLGASAVLGGQLAVPDYAAHEVLVIDPADGRLVQRLDVPGNGDRFDLTVSGGYLWANDPTERRAVSLSLDGEAGEVDKGTGRGVGDEAAEAEALAAQQEADRAAAERAVEQARAEELRRAQEQLAEQQRQADAAAQAPPVLAAPGPAPAAPAPALPLAPPPSQAPNSAASQAPRPAPSQAPRPAPSPAPSQASSPAPSPAAEPEPPPPVTVPDVVNQEINAACDAVRQAGLVCTAVDDGNGAPQNTAVAQAPAGGSQAAPGSEVVVRWFSRCRLVDVPNLVGAGLTDARAAASAGGFVLSELADMAAKTPGVVLQQDVPPGQVCEGSAVPVHYEPNASVLFHKYARDVVRILRPPNNPPSNASDVGPVAQVYAAGGPGLVEVTSWTCNCGAAGPGNRMYVGLDRENPGPGPTADAWQLEGNAFFVYADPRPGTVPLFRSQTQTPSGATFEYSVSAGVPGVRAVLMGHVLAP